MEDKIAKIEAAIQEEQKAIIFHQGALKGLELALKLLEDEPEEAEK